MLQRERAESDTTNEQQGLAVVNVDPNVRDYLGDFVSDEAAITDYIAARVASDQSMLATTIDLSTERFLSPPMRGYVLGRARENQITLFVPDIVHSKPRRKYLMPEKWLLASEEWGSLPPLERMNRILMHELEHVIHSHESRMNFMVSVMSARMNTDFVTAASRLGGVAASVALLYGGAYLTQRGAISEGTADLTPLSLLGIARLQKIVMQKAAGRIYIASPHEVRANAASLQSDQQFFKPVT